MSLHIDGACPAFRDTRHGSIGTYIYPQGYYGVEYQVLFDTLLLNRHMREPEVTRNFRLSQYRPFTKDPFQRVIHVVTGAIFQDTGYSIIIDNYDDNEYIWGNNFDGNTLPGYITCYAKNIFEDPNGFFVVIPAQPYYETTTERIQPKIHFAHSKNILHYTSEELVYSIQDDLGAETVWVVNKIGYFRFAKNSDGKYEHIDSDKGGYYAHLLKKLPVVKAGGLWNTQGYYDSWLDAGKAFADDFISNKSAEQLVNKEASHPYLQVASEECPDCVNGTIETCTQCNKTSDSCSCAEPNPAYYSLRRCNSCGGTNQKVRNPADWLIAPAEEMDKDLIKFHNPDIKINEFHAKNNREIFDGIIKSLHLHWIDQSQSGIAKDRDMETRYQFISSIANDWFDRLLPQLIDSILSLRNVRTENGVTKPYSGSYTITKPSQFAIKTAQELLNEYKTASDSKAPLFILCRQMEDYVDKLYGGDMVLKKKARFIIRFDKYSVASIDYIQASILNGAGTSRDLKFHEQLPLMLDDIIEYKGKNWFLAASYDEIKDIVMTEFDKKNPELPTLVNPNEFSSPETVSTGQQEIDEDDDSSTD